MNTNKIEIYWTLIPKEENQWQEENELNFRIKSDDFDYVIGGVIIDKNEINNLNALNILLNELSKPSKEIKKPIIFNWFKK